jgi:hypothetical protein
MSLLTREGIKALSQLDIDADKDWQRHGISNIKEVAADMSIGDINARGVDVLEKIIPGTIGYVLTSAGPGHLPAWLPAPTPLEWYYPVWVELTKSVINLTPDKLVNLAALISSGYLNQTVPSEALTVGSALAIAAMVPDEEIALLAPSPTTGVAYYEFLLDGAIAYYGSPPSEVDELSQSRSDTPNDMHLPPQNPTIPPDECYYFGCLRQFDLLKIVVSTAGVGNFTVATTYWDGSAWSVPPALDDQLNDFQSTGTKQVSWTVPGDWALKTIGGYNLYWIRIACVNMVTLATPPLGQKSWVRIV